MTDAASIEYEGASAASDAAVALREVAIRLRGYSYPCGRESVLQRAVEQALQSFGIEFEQQRQLGRARFDFWMPTSRNRGLVIELKVDTNFAQAMRQCFDYTALNEVDGVLLATPESWASNDRLIDACGKPVVITRLATNLSL